LKVLNNGLHWIDSAGNVAAMVHDDQSRIVTNRLDNSVGSQAPMKIERNNIEIDIRPLLQPMKGTQHTVMFGRCGHHMVSRAEQAVNGQIQSGSAIGRQDPATICGCLKQLGRQLSAARERLVTGCGSAVGTAAGRSSRVLQCALDRVEHRRLFRPTGRCAVKIESLCHGGYCHCG
jgi:hypothetical protein